MSQWLADLFQYMLHQIPTCIWVLCFSVGITTTSVSEANDLEIITK